MSDILQSLALVTGPFAPPTGTKQSPWARGNVHTCDANGFILTMSACAIPMYTCALCIYYYCKLKSGMSDDQFYRKIEKVMHAGIISFNILVGIISLGTNTYNASPLAGFCYFAALPQGCNYPGSENYGQCVRGKHSFVFIFTSTIIPPSLSLIGITLTTISICMHAAKQRREFRSFVPSEVKDRALALEGNSANSTVGRHTSNRNFYDKDEHETEAQFLSRLYVNESVKQSCLYVGGFTVIYIVPLITCLLVLGGNLDIMEETNAFPILFFSCFPLGGFFNILIYTRPKVAGLRRLEPRMPWLQALYLVIKAGGEIPDDTTMARRLWFSCCIFCCCNSRQNDAEMVPHHDLVPSPEVNNGNPAPAPEVGENDMSNLGVDGMSLSLEEGDLPFGRNPGSLLFPYESMSSSGKFGRMSDSNSERRDTIPDVIIDRSTPGSIALDNFISQQQGTILAIPEGSTSHIWSGVSSIMEEDECVL